MNFAPYVGRMKERLAKAETALSDPAVFSNQQRAAGLTREYARLKEAVFATEACLKAEADLAENTGLLKETTDPELAELAREEIARLETELPRLQLQAMSGLLPADPTAGRNTIIEIRAGAGGAESALFAADLYRMLTRYAERRNWKHEAMDTNPSDLGGFREVIFSVSGPDAFKRLKFESGVHRVQRVPATETQGRIHTSTVTIAVLPEAEEVDVEIRSDELEITVCRASGPGGQGVNTTDSAVQILHKPTGLIVRCADERSQIKNKARAMKVLRSRLLSRKIAEEEARYAARRKAQVGTGERNEKIRTYNFPQNRVTDHRVDLSVHDLSGVLDGKLDLLIEPLLEHDLQERLKELVL